jgi:hypothetical protein
VLVGTDPVGSVHTFRVKKRTGRANDGLLIGMPRNLAQPATHFRENDLALAATLLATLCIGS